MFATIDFNNLGLLEALASSLHLTERLGFVLSSFPFQVQSSDEIKWFRSIVSRSDWHKLFPLLEITRLIVLLTPTTFLNLHSLLATLPAWLSPWAISSLHVEPQNSASCSHAQAESPCRSAMTTSGSDQPLVISPPPQETAAVATRKHCVMCYSKSNSGIAVPGLGNAHTCTSCLGCTC